MQLERSEAYGANYNVSSKYSTFVRESIDPILASTDKLACATLTAKQPSRLIAYMQGTKTSLLVEPLNLSNSIPRLTLSLRHDGP